MGEVLKERERESDEDIFTHLFKATASLKSPALSEGLKTWVIIEERAIRIILILAYNLG